MDSMDQQYLVNESGKRVDAFLADQEKATTPSRLQALIDSGHVTVNGSSVKPSYKVKSGDIVQIVMPEPSPVDILPQDIPIAFIYQDEHIAVVDKPHGLPVHPGPGHPDGTLVNALLAHCPDIAGVGGEIRPGIVHRLDKDTSGLIMVAKTHDAHQSLAAQISSRNVDKGYLALCKGLLDSDEGIIDAPIGRDPYNRKRMAVVENGRHAKTIYTVLDRLEGYTYLGIKLETGRTHQIRVHMAYLNHPLVGDTVYGRSSNIVSRHFLHAHYLAFRHPVTGEPIEFQSTLPKDLSDAFESITLK